MKLTTQQKETINQANRILALAGLPSYTETAQSLERLAQYVGGWDEAPAHPCGEAAALLARLGLPE